MYTASILPLVYISPSPDGAERLGIRARQTRPSEAKVQTLFAFLMYLEIRIRLMKRDKMVDNAFNRLSGSSDVKGGEETGRLRRPLPL